jgi:hypothetical protein
MRVMLLSQYDVLDWLRKQREENDNFFSIKEIREGLKKKEIDICEATVRRSVSSLFRGDLIELELGGGLLTWQRFFRAKK